MPLPAVRTALVLLALAEAHLLLPARTAHATPVVVLETATGVNAGGGAVPAGGFLAARSQAPFTGIVETLLQGRLHPAPEGLREKAQVDVDRHLALGERQPRAEAAAAHVGGGAVAAPAHRVHEPRVLALELPGHGLGLAARGLQSELVAASHADVGHGFLQSIRAEACSRVRDGGGPRGRPGRRRGRARRCRRA